jgi:hypothetical protein
MSRILVLAVFVLLALSLAARAAVETVPLVIQIVPLDAAVVVTGGVGVTALIGGHRTAGGWIFNPTTATTALCIDEFDTAVGTTSAGNTTCLPAGQSYKLSPSIRAVTVTSTDSGHAFSGQGNVP